jgi:hypothetical protein
LLAVVAQVLDELREDGLELLESGRHDGGARADAQRVYGLKSRREDRQAVQGATRTCRA